MFNQMTFNQKVALCRHLEKAASTNQTVRLATQWIRASLETEMDAMMRTQVLEGAFKLPWGHFWKKGGKRGLAAIKGIALEKAPNMDPQWFEYGTSDWYRDSRKVLLAMLARSGRSGEPAEDILQNALMGLTRKTMSPGSDGTGKPMFYEIGVYLSAKVQDGEESPQTVKSGLVFTFLKRKLLNYLNTEKSHQLGPAVRDDEETGTVEDPHVISGLVMEVLLSQDPLGQAIRDLMRKSWEGTTQQAPMDLFVSIMENEQRIPSLKEIADLSGITAQTMGQTVWQTAMPRFDALWRRSPKLQQALETKMLASGLDPDSFSPEQLFNSGDFGSFRRWTPGKYASNFSPSIISACLLSRWS